MTAERNQFRDAVRFKNGREILIHELLEDTRVEVLDLRFADSRQPVIETAYAYGLMPVQTMRDGVPALQGTVEPRPD